MRRIIIILCVLVWAVVANGTTYYVSNNGNDNNAGTSENAPWASIQKVQSSMGSFRSGDVILFRRGDTFRGGLNISVSGLTVGAYGSGSKPVIKGSKLLSGFSKNDKIWSLTNSELPADENYLAGLFIKGVFQRLGRYPDDGFLYFESSSGNNVIVDNQISSSGTWDGGEVVVRTMNYIYDRLSIGTQRGGTFNLSESATYSFGTQSAANNGYFIQNHDNTLSKDGEWNYNASNNTLKVYYSGDLNSQIVEMPVHRTGINVTASVCAIKDIEIREFEYTIFQIGSMSNLTIDNVTARFSNYFLKESGDGNMYVQNCDISNITSDAIWTGGYSAYIYNNKFTNIGSVAGLDDGSYGYRALVIEYAPATIRRNSFTNIGYNVINWHKNTVSIDSNLIDGFCQVLNDGGGIYAYKTTNTGSVVRNNIIMNSGNPSNGSEWHPGIGLYQDNACNGITWENNTCINVDFGCRINEAQGGVFRNNNFLDVGLMNDEWPDAYGILFGFPSQNNITFTNNVIVGNELFQNAWWGFSSSYNNVTSDYNYWIAPWGDPEKLFKIGGSSYYSLEDWKRNNPYDNSWEDNSKTTPIRYTASERASDKIIYLYNSTDSEKSYPLNSNYSYIDKDGNSVGNEVVIPAFSSDVFFVNGLIGEEIKVESIDVNPSSTSIDIGEELELSYNITPSNATNKSVTWKSSNPSILEVNSSGVIRGVSPGNSVVTITTRDGGHTSTCSVNVEAGVSENVNVESISLDIETINLAQGETFQINATISPANASNQSLSWFSDNPSIATVNSSGIVRGISVGETLVIVSAENGNISRSCKIIVNAKKSGGILAAINVNPSNTILQVGKVQQLNVSTTPADIGEYEVSYVSLNSEIATVSAQGVVTGMSKGNTKIIVSIDNITTEVNITVADNSSSVEGNYLRLDEKNISGQEGLFVNQTNLGGWHENDYVFWKSVNLNNVVSIQISYSVPYDGRQFSIHLDTENGPVLISGTVNSTGSWDNNFEIISFDLPEGNYGFRDLYVVGENVNTWSLDYVDIVYDNSISENTVAPVISIDFDESAYSGEIKTLDASSTFDPDGDMLTYLWTAPDGIDLSSETGNRISYLVPDTYYPVKKTFNLKVSDGENTVERNIEVTFTPYKPEVSKVNVVNVEASYFDGQNHPVNMLDGDPTTYWSAKGDNHWVALELNEPTKLSHLKVAFYGVDDKKSQFDVYVSNDETTWEPLTEKFESCGFSSTLHLITCEGEPMSDYLYKYVKVVGHGNDVDDNNTLSELEIYGGVASSVNDNFKQKSLKLYPNPCTSTFFVDSESYGTFNILDIQGRILNSYEIQIGINEIIHNLPSGVYFGMVRYSNGENLTSRFIVK